MTDPAYPLEPNPLLPRLDVVGAGASFLCALHCAAMPVLLTTLPLAGLEILASHRLERVTRTGWNPWLLPDGRRLLYLDRIVHGDLRLRDLATGEDRRVLESPAETPLEVFTPSRDFDRLYLSRWLGEGDLWSATLEVP